MELGIKGKTAVVTGAGRGIGRAVAVALSREGVRVALVSRTARELDSVATEIRDLGGEALALPCDLSSTHAIAELHEGVRKELGRVEILVNSAAPDVRNARLEKVGDEDFAAVVHASLDMTFRMTRAFVPDMKEAGWGRIVNVGSLVGAIGGYGQVAYSTAKAALVGLTRTVAIEVGHLGITCNLVVLGAIETERLQRSLAPEARPILELKTALKRTGSPEEAAAPIVFLASAPAAFVTGAELVVSGGFELNFGSMSQRRS